MWVCSWALLFIFSLLASPVRGGQTIDELFQALETAAYWDKKLYERFPVTFNHILSTGYLTTHSARMTAGGALGFGVAHIPPYQNWNVRVEPFSHLELSVNYRIFKGCKDELLAPFGFGDYADRGANVKLSVFTPEESLYHFPGLAVGIDDFMGSKKFTTYYIVATQVMKDWGLEMSAGWGTGQYTRGPSCGFFGGFNWFPLWNCSNRWTKGLGFTAELDPTCYAANPHPNGRHSHSPINVGAKYTFSDLVELSCGWMRGSVFAASGSLHCNFGALEGFLPKLSDPPLYTAPIDTEPLGCYRPQNLMAQELNYALEGQGFELTHAWLETGPDGQTRLWLMLMNETYRLEHVVRIRLQNLLASLLPENIADVTVIVESFGLPCQQYVYNRELLLRYAYHYIGEYEFDILTARENARPPPPNAELIFQQRYELWRSRIAPRFETFFGNAKGKFKYDLGVKLSLEGFLPYNWFYESQVSYTALSTLKNIADFDYIHPSQLPNVATDYVRYRQQSAFTWDMLYLQKSWNFCNGYFGRLAGGYFQVNYAGVAGELLWYPADSCIAIGLEGAVVRKRNYAGLGFQSKLREFDGREPIYIPYTTLQQYFLDLYLDFPGLGFFTKISAGQFLAGDFGAAVEATRYFANGFRLTGWMTFTNAGDVIHGERYFNRGVALEIPFDFFYKCSSRKVWNYAMAAWLRDAGYFITTGKSLFYTLNRERRW